jgi:hypothetical protein
MKEFVEKLIERLEEEVKYQVQKEEEAHLDGEKISTSMARQAMGNCYNHAIEIVNQLAEEYGKDTNVTTNGWIPCSERLPRIGEQVMVCNRFGSVFVSHITYLKPRIDMHGECNDFGNHYGVIAWQPLPTSYKK